MKKRPQKKIAIVGGNTKAPVRFDLYDDGWEIWALNAIRPHWLPEERITRCFNLHRYTHLQRDWHHGIYVEAEWANAHQKIPFYLVDRWPRALLPNQIMFPRNELAALPRGGSYHAGSFDMMVALAVLEKVQAIALFGVGLNLESGEPISARACLEYWVGVAEGRGIRVMTSHDCDLFAQYHLVRSHTVYGYDDVRLVEDRK